MSALSEGSARTQTVREPVAHILGAWEGRCSRALDAFAQDPEYLLRIADNYERIGDGGVLRRFDHEARRFAELSAESVDTYVE